ncbi:MAG: phosphoenolpyruvate hydrolase family protein [Sedimentibacter sp.]
MTKCACEGGADILVLLISSIFRDMGRSSLTGYMPVVNSNEVVMHFGKHEILTLATEVPVIFGLCANDPTIVLENYLDEIISEGFSGIIDYPTVGLIDGNFRDMLEDANLGYQNEVNAIRLAHEKGLFTIAYVFDSEQAKQMIDAGADVICVQLGLTHCPEDSSKGVTLLEQGIDLLNISHDLKSIIGVWSKAVLKSIIKAPRGTKEYLMGKFNLSTKTPDEEVAVTDND